jgi:hypothetical protein
MGGICGTHGRDYKFVQNFWSEKHDGKRPVVRPRHRWEDNITTDLREMGWKGVELIHLAQSSNQWRAIMNMVMNFWIQQKAGNFLTS